MTRDEVATAIGAVSGIGARDARALGDTSCCAEVLDRDRKAGVAILEDIGGSPVTADVADDEAQRPAATVRLDGAIRLPVR